MDTGSATEELVEVEVVPQTVNEIIYLQEEDLELESFEDDETAFFMPVVKFEEDDTEQINFVPVDNDVLPYLTVTLQETQPADEDCAEFDDDLSEDNVLAKSAVKCGINLYECKLCNKRFKSWNFISSHIVTHGKEWRENLSKKKLSCTQCRETFDDPRSLTYHFKWEHDVPRSFICDICSCSFVSENGLAGHYKKHFHPKEFVCSICSAGYDSPIDIENHYKTHRTNLLYACNKCDAGFAGTMELSAHLRHVHPRKPVIRTGVREIRPLIVVERTFEQLDQESEQFDDASPAKSLECVQQEVESKPEESPGSEPIEREEKKVVKKRGRPKKRVIRKTRKL